MSAHKGPLFRKRDQVKRFQGAWKRPAFRQVHQPVNQQVSLLQASKVHSEVFWRKGADCRRVWENCSFWYAVRDKRWKQAEVAERNGPNPDERAILTTTQKPAYNRRANILLALHKQNSLNGEPNQLRQLFIRHSDILHAGVGEHATYASGERICVKAKVGEDKANEQPHSKFVREAVAETWVAVDSCDWSFVQVFGWED